MASAVRGLVAGALAIGMAFGAAPATAQSEFPVLELETRKAETVRGLNQVVARFETTATDDLQVLVRDQVETHLPVLRGAYDRAKEEITRTVNASDALLEDQRTRKIDQAFETAGLEDAILEFRRRLENGVGQGAVELYGRQVEALFQVIDERYTQGIPPEFQRYVRENLTQAVSDDARTRLGEAGEVQGDGNTPIPLAPIALGALAILVRRVVVNNLGRALVRRLGATLVGRALTGVGKVLGPLGLLVDLAIAIGALVFAWQDAGEQTRTAIRDKIDENYQTEIEAKLLDDDKITQIAGDIADPLVDELRRTRGVLVTNLDRTYDCIVVQGQSDGAMAYVRSLADRAGGAEALRGLVADQLEQLCLVFGLDYQDVPFPEKAALVNDIGPGLAQTLVRRHGRAFVDLYRREPEAVARLARLSEGRADLLSGILASGDVDAELRFYSGLLARIEGLTPTQARAAALARSLVPDLGPPAYTRTGLESLGSQIDALDRLSARHRSLTGDIVRAVLGGDLSARDLASIMAPQDGQSSAFLFALYQDIGSRRFSELLEVMPPADMPVFLRIVGERRAQAMLRDAVALEVLRIYQDPSRGGRRAAFIHYNLNRDDAEPLDSEGERIAQWLATRTDIAGSQITRGLIADLKTVGIMAYPDVVAKPVATVLSYASLWMILVAIAGLLLMPVLLIILRIAFPRPRVQKIVVRPGTRQGGK